MQNPFLSTMEHFLGLTLDEIGSRYKTNNLLLVEHLLVAGLLSDAAPECHGKMRLHASDP